MKMKNKYAFVGAAVVSAFIGLTPLLASAGEVNVYSYRKPKLIDPMFEVFTGMSSANLAALTDWVSPAFWMSDNLPISTVKTRSAGLLAPSL